VKLKDRLETKKDRLENALELSKRRVEEIDTQEKSRQANTMIAGAGAVLGALFGGKRNARSIANAVGSVASKAGQTATTSERKQTAEARVQQTTDDLADIEQEIIDEVTQIDEKWKTVAESIDTVAIRLEATDVRVTDVRLVWVPVD
jgi:multidrug resistance efflux pump